MQKKVISFLVLAVLSFILLQGRSITAQTPSPSTPTPTPDPSTAISNLGDCASNNIEIKDCPGYLQKKLGDLQGQEKTLSSQIAIMDGQIDLTQARINATKEQISELALDIQTTTKKIGILESSISDLSKILLNRIVETYEIGSVQPLSVLLSSSTISDYFTRANYIRIAQAHDKRIAFDMVQAKNDYSNQKAIFEAKKRQVEALQQQLQDYNNQLAQEKSSKQQLLTQTQGSETNYQNLLSAAEAQLAGFSNFVNSQGGASLLSNQTVCDDWGCYYNQRDTQWGALALNNTKYSIASDGCLMTSVAMVYTHFGHKSVTPININSNPSNFASYEPAWLNKTVVADGTTSTRTSSNIDGELSAGRPVIVGISYDGGPLPDHFVVLISGASGSYQMNDPFVPNGHNISFTS